MENEECANDLKVSPLNYEVSPEFQGEQHLKIQEGNCKVRLFIEHVDRPCNSKVLISKLQNLIFDPGGNYEDTDVVYNCSVFCTNS